MGTYTLKNVKLYDYDDSLHLVTLKSAFKKTVHMIYTFHTFLFIFNTIKFGV